MTLLAQPAAFLLARSATQSAPERAAVLKAAASGDINAAMDAMLAWAISERQRGDGRRTRPVPDDV